MRRLFGLIVGKTGLCTVTEEGDEWDGSALVLRVVCTLLYTEELLV